MGKTTGQVTGKTRHRLDWRGRLILQVEVRQEGFPAGHRPTTPDAMTVWTEWRDARAEDLRIEMAPAQKFLLREF